MIAAKHTPGPWFADINRGYGHPFRQTPNIPINPVVMGAPVNRSLAKVPRGYAEAEANAILIAAAPELLEALQDLVANLQRNRDGNYLLINDGTGINRYAAAIAKAIGGAA